LQEILEFIVDQGMLKPNTIQILEENLS
jgi:hypothetical protein